MDRRLQLHRILKSIPGIANVYFQPPSDTRLEYPCIIYRRDSIDQKYADNQTYNARIRYSILLIGDSPENAIVSKILELPYCSYDRFYTADGLNHDSFTIFY